MGIYDRKIAATRRKIAAKGERVQWRQIANGPAADPAKPWLPGAAVTTDKPTSIAFFPLSSGVPQELKAMVHLPKDSEVPTGIFYGLMGAVNFEPSLKDVVIRDSKEVRIHSIDPFKVNEQTIFYAIGFTQ